MVTLTFGRVAAQPPAAPAESRGIWLTTVQGLDFPAGAGTSDITAQRNQILSLLDTCTSIGINTVLLQVRTECDAFYVSAIEPWSRWLTGTQGVPPARIWDPLQFTIDECRRRGLEIHAWFNPYRAGVSNSASFASNHPLYTQPQIVVPFSTYYWLNPGHPDTIPYTTSVIMDVVDRYDVDGIHFDDYFYPYGISSSSPFPDSNEYNAYVAGGGTMSLGDWRRANVNNMITSVTAPPCSATRQEPRTVRHFPFGIWKSGVPRNRWARCLQRDLRGLAPLALRRMGGLSDAPALLGASRRWPSTQQDFDTLLNWWTSSAQNPLGRPVFAGLPAYKLLNSRGGNRPMSAIKSSTNNLSAGTRSCFFRTVHLTMNNGHGIGNDSVGYLSELLVAGPYQQKAAPVAYTHKDTTRPQLLPAWAEAQPLGGLPIGNLQGQSTRSGTSSTGGQAQVVHDVLPDWQRSATLAGSAQEVGIQAIDRFGNRSSITTGILSSSSPPLPPLFTSENVRNHDSDSLDFFTASGSNRYVSTAATVSTNEEANNRIDPRVGPREPAREK